MRIVVLPGLDGSVALRRDFVDALPTGLLGEVLPYPHDVVLDYAGLVAHVLPRLPRSESYILLGESFGGPLAILLATQRPQGLAGIALCATFARHPNPMLRMLAATARYAPITRAGAHAIAPLLLGRWRTPPLVAMIERSLVDVSPDVLRARMEAALRVDCRDALSALSVPVMYLRASEDHVVSSAAGDEVARVAPRTILVTEVGPHALLQVKPDACAQHIVRLVDRCSE